MSDASRRRVTQADGHAPGQAMRFAIVVLCLLTTACVYVGCLLVVLGGHVEVLFNLVPWLATTALGTIVVVTIWALLSASHARAENRHRITARRIRRLARRIGSLEPPERALAKKQLIERLDVTRDALCEVIRADPAVGDELVAGGVASRVERELAGPGGKWHRVSAAGVLGLLASETSIAPLRDALSDPDVDVGYAAAQALALYTSPTAYEALFFALARGRLPEARIAGLLEASRCPHAREVIERRADSENPRTRYWVAYLLGSLADRRSAPVVERLAQDPDEDVRANAAESLASFPNPSLLSRLLSDGSWVVRSHAAKAAGASRQVGLAGQLGRLLEDGSWWVRQNAMLALAGFGDAAVPVLLGQLRSNDRFARNKAAEALVRSGYAKRQIEIVKSGVPGAQEARRVLIGLGRAEALNTILTAVRGTSAPDARARLLSVLQDIGTDGANSASEQLADLEQPEALRELSASSGSPNASSVAQ